jgi:hypothetical protein
MSLFAPGNAHAHNGLGGRPKGSKNKLHRSFIEALTADFEANGEKAIRQLRVTNPGKYLQIIANTLPREFFFQYDTVTSLTDDELDRMIETFRSRMIEERKAAPLLIESNVRNVTE